MPFDPTTRHPDYTKRLPQWKRQRDCIEGEDAIKARGVVYLPALAGQAQPLTESLDLAALQSQSTWTPEQANGYLAYLRRASFLNATERTVGALSGLLFTKPPAIEWPASDVEALEVIGRSGETFYELASETADEVIGIGRYGLLVDFPAGDPNPYVAQYAAESIVDWAEGVVGGRVLPIRVNLVESETYVDGSKNEQERETVRVLHLFRSEAEVVATFDATPIAGLRSTDFREGPVYVQSAWVRETKEGKHTLRSAIVVQAPGGRVFREIPFVFFGPKDTRARVAKPPLLDLAVVNLSHYRNSADLEHGAHFTALPQPWVSGWKGKQAEMSIGSSNAWVMEDPGARAGYLEFTGAGLGFLQGLMAEKRSQMASLGARMLEDQGAEESGVAKELRQRGDSSALSRIGMALSEGLTYVLQFVAEARGADPRGVSFKLTKQLGIARIDAQMFTALMAGVQQGTISHPTFFRIVQAGGVIPEDHTYKQEAEEIAEGRPGGPGGDGQMGRPKPSKETSDPADDDEDGTA
jgi:hypothetical protein